MNREETHYYFDTNALIKYYLNESETHLVEKLVQESPHPILISPVTLLEFIDHIVHHWRTGHLSADEVKAILENRLRRDYSTQSNTQRSFLLTSAPSSALYIRAEAFLLRYAAPEKYEKRGKTGFDKGRKIGAKDMLHIAIAEKLQDYGTVFMVTWDEKVQDVCKKLKIPYYATT